MIMQQPTSGPVPVSKVLPFIGLYQSFNAAVNHIASRLNPRGWDITPAQGEPCETTWAKIPGHELPLTIDGLRAYVRSHGRLIISGDYSDQTIYGDRETNYAFRAWHDWCHLKLDAPFDAIGERAVSALQQEHLVSLYGARASHYWRKLIDAEVVGQTRYVDYHGAFVKDQVAFDLHYIAGGAISRVFH